MSGFPWRSHRTLAQVAETARLLMLKRAGEKLPHKGDQRLDDLLWKVRCNNPAPAPPDRDDAA